MTALLALAASWLLPPIVDDVGAGAAITGIVVLVHAHALDFRTKSARDKMPIGLLARQIRARQQVRHADGDRQSLTRVEQPKIILFGQWPVSRGTEFDEAIAGAGLTARSIVTHREGRNAAAAV